MIRFALARDAAQQVSDGMTVMIGGFLGVGSPEGLVDAVAGQGAKNLTVIANDTAFPGVGVGKLQDQKRIAKLYASYIGGHPLTGQCMEAGELNVILTPQGTLVEQIRAGGAGLGGFLTPTGVGTIVAEGKDEFCLDGKAYILEKPLFADVALIKAYKADKSGNLTYRLSARNFNPLMAMAAKCVIAEVEEVVPDGALDPDHVITPGIFIDIIVKRGN